MGRFFTEDLNIDGLKKVTRQPFCDHRGFLTRLFCAKELESMGWSKPIAQINHTHTAKMGTVRGMHYQKPPHAEIKLVTCIRGQIWDVVIDLRLNSPTFLTWQGAMLSAENNTALLIPEGCAHGFQTLSDDVELLYFHSAPYKPDAEDGLNPQDPLLGIDWPEEITEISQRDQNHSFLTSLDQNSPLYRSH